MMIPVLLLALCSAVFAGAPAPAAGAAPSFKKVVIVVLENTDFQDALVQPFMSELAKKGALLKDFHAITHPSQPNYIALTAGDTHRVTDNSNVTLDVPHIGTLLEKAGKTWKVYAEGYPGGCYLGRQRGAYVRKHVPFLSYKDVQKDPVRCARIVDESSFEGDVKGGRLADYSLFIPDNNNSGHDTGVDFADKWLAKTFGPLLTSFPKEALLVITFDEDSNNGGDNKIYTVLYGGSAAPGAVSSDRLDLYSLLRTIEDALGLGTLGLRDASAPSIRGVWKP